MIRSRVYLVLTLIAVACAGGCKSVPHADATKSKAAAPMDAASLDVAIRRGVDFLVATQNRDGSWGSATLTKDLNITAAVPGSHHGFRTGTTALCVSALVEAGGDDPRVAASLDRAETFLLSYLPRVRRPEMMEIYNVWAHAYSIHALARLLDRPVRTGDDPQRRQRLLDMVARQVKQLGDYEFVGGGWGYYDFDHHLQQPGGSPTSFTTATVLLALQEARRLGADVPQKLIDRGLAEVRRQRNPNGTYHYSRDWWVRPTGVINRPAGSLGRSQACNAALRTWGDPLITDAVLTTWLDRLFARSGWLDIGRKRPIPHEAWFAVAGYFYYYGHYHAALCIHMLPAEQRAAYQNQLAHTLVERQEKDGSWFDFPLYAYHKPYGTAFALMSLRRCMENPPAPTETGAGL